MHGGTRVYVSFALVCRVAERGRDSADSLGFTHALVSLTTSGQLQHFPSLPVFFFARSAMRPILCYSGFNLLYITQAKSINHPESVLPLITPSSPSAVSVFRRGFTYMGVRPLHTKRYILLKWWLERERKKKGFHTSDGVLRVTGFRRICLGWSSRRDPEKGFMSKQMTHWCAVLRESYCTLSFAKPWCCVSTAGSIGGPVASPEKKHSIWRRHFKEQTVARRSAKSKINKRQNPE